MKRPSHLEADPEAERFQGTDLLIDDLDSLSIAFFENIQRNDYCEYGGIGLDDKRPFGNSDVDADICEIIGMDMEGDDGDEPCWASYQRQYAADLYNKLPDYLRVKYLPKDRP